MSQIAIIDPALGRTGAHNRGFALHLASQESGSDGFGIWCNNAIGHDLYDELVSCGVTVRPVFDLDFYQILQKQRGGIADHWSWIYGLARQYLKVFEQALQRWPHGTVHLLHHTLSWEHASALALAINLEDDGQDRLRHMAFLMFSPGVDEAGQTHDADAALNYRLAFAPLAASPVVRLYAACSEYAKAYGHLLDLPRPLPIHPCFLGDWHARPAGRTPGKVGRILLYAGEIKQEKGFLRLPHLLARILRATPETTEIVMQFVAVRNNAARKVLRELSVLARDHPRVRLHEGFWSDRQLRETLETTDLLCLDYDASAYRHATSGLLWLAAWYRIPVMVPGESWLQREAKRLGVPLVAGVDELSSGRASNADATCDEAYFQALFTPFRDWLQNRAIARDGAEEPGVNPPGADVVVFWKQNDTGLYGRRSDMVIRYLASRPDVRRVIVVDAAIGDANLERLRQDTATPTHNQRIYAEIRAKLAGSRDTEKVSYHVYVCPLAKFRFREDGTARPHFIDGYVDYLTGVFASRGVDPAKALFWIYPTNFHVPKLVDRFRPARIVVDVEDDQRAWPGVPETRKAALSENYRQLLHAADVALTNCEPLRQSMAPLFDDIRLVPNGCDVDPPHKVPHDSKAFDEFKRFTGKVIGFVGNLESKIDMELLQKVAERFTDCRIVLLGSTHANPGVYALSRNPNVFMPGVVPYAEVDAWLRKFDVGLVPHLRTELTRSMNPQKIYAYLSSHVPVVSTDVPNIPRDTELVRVAATHERFLDEVAEVLAAERPSVRKFEEYKSSNSWEERLRPLVDSLELRSLYLHGAAS